MSDIVEEARAWLARMDAAQGRAVAGDVSAIVAGLLADIERLRGDINTLNAMRPPFDQCERIIRERDEARAEVERQGQAWQREEAVLLADLADAANERDSLLVEAASLEAQRDEARAEVGRLRERVIVAECRTLDAEDKRDEARAELSRYKKAVAHRVTPELADEIARRLVREADPAGGA